MKSIVSILAISCMSLVMTACHVSNEETGTLTGAAVGGLAGSQFGHGGGHVAATAGGVILGGLVGGRVGHTMDDTDRLKLYHAMEMNTHETWINPNTGYRYIAEPVRTYHWRHYKYCRQYITRVFTGTRWDTVHGTACRAPDGGWQIAH